MQKRIAINGIGRIGRHILRRLLNDSTHEIVLINEINNDIENIAYTLNYDSIYKNNNPKFTVKNNYLNYSNHSIFVTHKNEISKDCIKQYKVDYIIDASGNFDNFDYLRSLLQSDIVDKIFLTYSPGLEDITLVIGANENLYKHNLHRLISCSICDASAIAPILKIIDLKFDIINGYITTLHPVLNYQNVLDGRSSSWAHPGETYHHFALGRSFNNLIPKPTSAMDVTRRSVNSIKDKNIPCFSYRTPLEIVSSADISLNIKKEANLNLIKDELNVFEENQKYKIISSFHDPLVSRDFIGNEFSSNIDLRWLDVVDKTFLKIVLWYDNEYAYSSRVVDQINYVSEK